MFLRVIDDEVPLAQRRHSAATVLAPVVPTEERYKRMHGGKRDIEKLFRALLMEAPVGGHHMTFITLLL